MDKYNQKRLMKQADENISDDMLYELAKLRFNHQYSEIDLSKLKNVISDLDKQLNALYDKAEDIALTISENKELFEKIKDWDYSNEISDLKDGYSIAKFLYDEKTFDNVMKEFYIQYKAYEDKEDIIQELYDEIKRENLSLSDYNNLKRLYSK